MALIVKDRVRETTTTTGTGTVSLAGPVTGFQSFSVIGNTNTTYYAIVDAASGDWEVGIGTYTLSGTTLSRDTVLESSNSGALVPFLAGTKDVFCTYPAETSVSDGKANVIEVNSTDAALRITQTGTGNALVVEDSTNPDSTPFVIDTVGQVIVGSQTAITYASTVTPQLQVNKLGSEQVGISRFTNDTGGNALIFLKSRGTAFSDFNTVSSGDTIGTLGWYGADGTAGIQAAALSAVVDGTPGADDMPGRLVFSTTADGAATPTERMRIDSAGTITLASGSGLSIARTAVTTPATTDGNVFSGTYTPTLTNSTNVAASTPVDCHYMRVGNTVTVAGQVSIDVTTTATDSILLMTLPIASTFTAARQCGGTAASSSAGTYGVETVAIMANVANGSAEFRLRPTSTANLDYRFSFTYRVL